MDQQEWKKINNIVDTALELDEEERVTFIEEQCDGDEDLRYKVTELLDAIEQSDTEDFLEGTGAFPSHLAADFTKEVENPDSSLIGQTIGQYSIKKLIGHGGMGSVFLAERADDAYEKQVAFKVLRRGMDTPSNRARFKRERNILAKLSHPNIARLLDGGLTDNGLPYLVMEYVEGTPLLEYCDDHQLSVDDRLELFKAICEAVQHAHRNATIHRDLKPSNILVTDDGNIKVLDFGIAKLLEPENPEETLFETQTGARMLTLGYAAPEQITEKSITTATDSYTLGILLYEILAGLHPFDMDDMGLTQIEELIRNETPSRPSQKFNQLSEPKQKEIAKKRNTTPSSLYQNINGDLDAIVMKAIRKEPESRYQSAQILLTDLQRREENLPIIAREDTVRYKTGKFLNRHKTGLSVAAGFVLLIISFAFLYSWQITQERNRAQLEAEKAQQVSAFLTDLFQAGNPALNPDKTITTSILLNRGEQKIDQLDGQPEVQAQLSGVIGSAYRNLGEYQKADSLLEQSRTLEQNNNGPSSLEYADALHELGNLEHDKGNYAKAESLYRQELSIRRSNPESQPHEIAKSMSKLGFIVRHLYEYEEADSLYKAALELEIDKAHQDVVADLITGRSSVLRRMGDMEQAKQLAEQALTMRKEHLGEVHPKIAQSYRKLAIVSEYMHNFEQADSLYHRGISILKQVFEAPHPRIAHMLGHIGDMYEHHEHFEKAEPYLRKSLEMEQKIYGDNQPRVAHTYRHLATTLRELGNFDEAEEYMNQALSIFKKNYGETGGQVATVYNDLAIIYKEQGRYTMADSLYHNSLEIKRKLHDGPIRGIAISTENLGTLHMEAQNYQKAEEYHLKALEMWMELREISDPQISEQINDLTEVFSEITSNDKILARLKKALKFDENSFDGNTTTLAHIKILLGEALIKIENYSESEQLLTEGYQLLKEQNAPKSQIQDAEKNLSKLYESWGKHDLAKKYES